MIFNSLEHNIIGQMNLVSAQSPIYQFYWFHCSYPLIALTHYEINYSHKLLVTKTKIL